MPSSQLRFAERFLKLATTPEKAMAVIGDAAEHGETGLKLWVFVVQVAASLLWKAVAEQPGRMACLAVAGTLMQAMFWSLGVLCVLISATVALVCLALVRGEVTAPTNPMIYVFLLSIAVPAPWLTGRWLSRRAPGRELAPCLTMALLHAIVFAVGCAIYGDRLGLIDLPSGNVPAFLLLVANAASLFAGAAWVRERPGAALTWFERISVRHGVAASVVAGPPDSSGPAEDQRLVGPVHVCCGAVC